MFLRSLGLSINAYCNPVKARNGLPLAPPSPCANPGCPELVTAGNRCPAHSKARHKQIDANRGTSTERGYDVAWRILRRAVLIRDGFRCNECGWGPELVEMCNRYRQEIPVEAVFMSLTAMQQAHEIHLHVDHIQPIAQRPDLRLEKRNLQVLCSACHAAKSMSEMRAAQTGE